MGLLAFIVSSKYEWVLSLRSLRLGARYNAQDPTLDSRVPSKFVVSFANLISDAYTRSERHPLFLFSLVSGYFHLSSFPNSTQTRVMQGVRRIRIFNPVSYSDPTIPTITRLRVRIGALDTSWFAKRGGTK